MKAICIILMVACHGGLGLPYSKFIYFFHMPVFFMISGYVYKEYYSENFLSFLMYVKNKAIRLWIPYVVATSVCVVLNNFFISINVYTNHPQFLEMVSKEGNRLTDPIQLWDVFVRITKTFSMNQSTQLSGSLWFIKILFFLSVFYSFNDLVVLTLLKKWNIKNAKQIKLVVQGVIGVILLLIGYKYSKYFGIDNENQIKVSSYYILYYMGIILKQYRCVLFQLNNTIKNGICIVCFIGLCWMTITSRIEKFELARNCYNNPFCLLMASIFGWFFLYYFSLILGKISLVIKPLFYVGKHTLSVLVLHLLCFKIISCIGLILDNRPLFLMAAHPVLYYDGYWWIAYTAVGLLIPLTLSSAFSRIKRVLVELIKKKRLEYRLMKKDIQSR